MILLSQLVERYQGDLERLHGAELLPSHRAALQAMARCRKAGSDSMLLTCPNCKGSLQIPHSCGHRSCPHCQHHESQQGISTAEVDGERRGAILRQPLGTDRVPHRLQISPPPGQPLAERGWPELGLVGLAQWIAGNRIKGKVLASPDARHQGGSVSFSSMSRSRRACLMWQPVRKRALLRPSQTAGKRRSLRTACRWCRADRRADRYRCRRSRWPGCGAPRPPPRPGSPHRPARRPSDPHRGWPVPQWAAQRRAPRSSAKAAAPASRKASTGSAQQWVVVAGIAIIDGRQHSQVFWATARPCG